MIRGMVFVLMVCASFSASAKELTITLTDQEQQALLRLLDAGIKAQGLQGLAAANMVIGKLQAATQPSPAPAPEKKPQQ